MKNFIFFTMERVQVKVEFLFRSSKAIVYQFLTTPSCLVRWFCEKGDITGKTFTFSWEGADEVAELVENVENERLRFKWEDADDEAEYLEFTMSKSPITGDTILVITDYCDDDEVDDTRQLWESQIATMQKEMGGG